MNRTRGYWNPLNNSILVDWDGEGNIIKEYKCTIRESGLISIHTSSSVTRTSYHIGINRNDPDFESKIDTWVRNYRGLLR